ncbi:hypothetical protein PVAP13_7KG023500 [Panicum virgatum]|uniref:Uncharacterized protein n=1 Tax=Panicum virgatum TaxID=38727 RepID=A0A8T0QDS5_PANVG|nr:hypothetical protein PVAP13_7KG023500 [Panicum virgatum]
MPIHLSPIYIYIITLYYICILPSYAWYLQLKEMTKAHTILIALIIATLFSFNAVEGGSYMSKAVLSRKGLKEERKLATSGLNPSSVSSLPGLASSNTNGVNSNSEGTNTDMSGTGAAYTPMTSTTTDSHHDLSVDQYRRIIHNNQINP